MTWGEIFLAANLRFRLERNKNYERLFVVDKVNDAWGKLVFARNSELSHFGAGKENFLKAERSDHRVAARFRHYFIELVI